MYKTFKISTKLLNTPLKLIKYQYLQGGGKDYLYFKTECLVKLVSIWEYWKVMFTHLQNNWKLQAIVLIQIVNIDIHVYIIILINKNTFVF